MANQLFANNATTTTRGSTSTTATTIVVNSSSGFPTPTGGDFFVATLDGGGNYNEIVKVTAVSGNTWTVIRAQENTTAKLWQPNSRIECRVTAGTLGILGPNGSSDNISFIQAGTGAVTRTAQNKMRDIVNILDFGAINNGTGNNAVALSNAAAAAGEGGTVVFPPGRYRMVGPITCIPVTLKGAGQGATVLEFDNTIINQDGVVWSSPVNYDTEFGASNLTIKSLNGNGRYAFNNPAGVGLNALRPKPTYEHLSFRGNYTNATDDSFAQDFSWQYMLLLGDAWDLTIRAIDALGCYVPENDPNAQFLDGFIRSNPTEGILSMRISNVTTHNVANFFAIRQKTYFSMHNVDVARAWQGLYDAPDRIFESNRYAYGECNLNFVVFNCQKYCVNLGNRFFTNFSNVAIQRTNDAFDHGTEWAGLRLDDAETCQLTGIEINYPTGFTGNAIGLDLAGGLSNQVANITLGGPLTSGIRLKGRASDSAANQGTSITGVSTHTNGVALVFDLTEARGARISSFTKSSGVTFTTLVTYGNTATQQSCFLFQAPTDNSLEFDDDFFWVRPNGGTDAKRWRWNATDTSFNLATQGDSFAVGNNTVLITRNGLLIDKVELRTRNTAGGSILLNSPEVRAGAGFVISPPASLTPANNGDMQFQLTSNTQLTIKVKGSDGVVRSANITLA